MAYYRYQQITDALAAGHHEAEWMGTNGLRHHWSYDGYWHEWIHFVFTLADGPFVVDGITYRRPSSGHSVHINPMFTVTNDNGGAACMRFSAGPMTEEEADLYVRHDKIVHPER